MTRQLISNAEITKLINARLKEEMELSDDCRDVDTGIHRLLELNETDCNWCLTDWNRCPQAYKEVLNSIVKELQAQYNLKGD